MMTIEEEQSLVLNPVHGATLLWRSTKTYTEESQDVKGMPISLAMLILPLTLHQQTAEAITRVNKASGIGKVLLYDRSIRARLADRIQSFRELTWSSIFIGEAARMIRVLRTDEDYALEAVS